MPELAAFITALAASTAPLPPWVWWSETANSMPSSAQRARTTSTSSSVSVAKRFSTTTAGLP